MYEIYGSKFNKQMFWLNVLKYTVGVKQGCVLSPTMFKLFINVSKNTAGAYNLGVRKYVQFHRRHGHDLCFTTCLPATRRSCKYNISSRIFDVSILVMDSWYSKGYTCMACHTGI